MSEMKKISRFPLPEYDELPEDVKQIWDDAKEHFGFYQML